MISPEALMAFWAPVKKRRTPEEVRADELAKASRRRLRNAARAQKEYEELQMGLLLLDLKSVVENLHRQGWTDDQIAELFEKAQR